MRNEFSIPAIIVAYTTRDRYASQWPRLANERLQILDKLRAHQ